MHNPEQKRLSTGRGLTIRGMAVLQSASCGGVMGENVGCSHDGVRAMSLVSTTEKRKQRAPWQKGAAWPRRAAEHASGKYGSVREASVKKEMDGWTRVKNLGSRSKKQAERQDTR